MENMKELIQEIEDENLDKLMKEAKDGVNHMEDVVLKHQSQLNRHLREAKSSSAVFNSLMTKYSQGDEALDKETELLDKAVDALPDEAESKSKSSR